MNQGGFGGFTRTSEHGGEKVEEKKLTEDPVLNRALHECMGPFGAPQCRCTPLLWALCIALAGLIFVGAGACIVGFMSNDHVPLALGASLVVVGLIMMVAGGVFFVYDTFYRVRFPVGRSVGYSYQPQESTQFDQPSTSYGAAAPTSASDNFRFPKEHESAAPPAYDAINQGGRTRAGLAV